MRMNQIIALSLSVVLKSYATPALESAHEQPINNQHLQGMHLSLPSNAHQVLAKRVMMFHGKPTITCSHLPSKVELGMNGVPVLNQGEHESTECAFAATAAVDAALGKGDYISQLCLLQLGNYMMEHGQAPGGWDGALIPMELKRLENYGFVSKEQQHLNGCGDLREYPVHSGDAPTSNISYDDYHAMSEGLMLNGIVWSPILDLNRAISERTDTDKTLLEVKQSLNHGNRVTTTFLIVGDERNEHPGSLGKHHVAHDSWALSTSIERKLSGFFPSLYGHAMVITGFDDDAIAVDENGKSHQGLLTLRGSWGEKLGDHGDFYMSYDYFRVLVLDAQQITVLSAEPLEENKTH